VTGNVIAGDAINLEGVMATNRLAGSRGESLHKWATTISTIVMTLATAALMVCGIYMLEQLRIMREQTRIAIEQLHSTREQTSAALDQVRIAKGSINQAFDQDGYERRWERLSNLLSKLKGVKKHLDEIGALTPEQAALVLKDPDTRFAAKSLLNQFESFSVAVLEGTVDPKTAHNTKVYLAVAAYETFEQLIVALRTQRQNPDIYSELEKVYKAWKPRMVAK
jgi:hypothetical protein